MNRSHVVVVPTLFVLGVLAAPHAAQSVEGGLPYQLLPFGEEITHVVYDWNAQAVVSRTEISLAGGGAPPLSVPPCFGTSLSSFNGTNRGSFSVFNVGEEIVDWGVKTCRQSTVVTAFSFIYCTTAEDVSNGGPGAAMTFALYQGTKGFGVLGTEIRRFEFTGLPGRTTPFFTHYYITVDLTKAPLCIPDGNIGWGYQNDDGVSGPLMRQAPNAALGTVDALDVYNPGPATAGNFIGTFNFASQLPGSGSWFLAIEEAPPGGSAVTTVNGTGVNAVVFNSLSAPVIGSSWLASIQVPRPRARLTVVGMSADAIAPLTLPSGELLIDLNHPLTFFDFGYALHSVPLPKNAALIGLTVHTQGAIIHTTGKFQLTNGLDLVLGV